MELNSEWFGSSKGQLHMNCSLLVSYKQRYFCRAFFKFKILKYIYLLIIPFSSLSCWTTSSTATNCLQVLLRLHTVHRSVLCSAVIPWWSCVSVYLGLRETSGIRSEYTCMSSALLRSPSDCILDSDICNSQVFILFFFLFIFLFVYSVLDLICLLKSTL